MPPVRPLSSRNRKPPPQGFSDLEDTLLSFSNKMKDAQAASHEGRKRHETVWPIMQISHQRSRYVYDLYYGRRWSGVVGGGGAGGVGGEEAAEAGKKTVNVGGPPAAISKQLYDYLLKNGYADAALIAKWKKQGYEKLCCLKCVQTKETHFSSTCICRVPKATLERGDKDGGPEGVGGDGQDGLNDDDDDDDGGGGGGGVRKDNREKGAGSGGGAKVIQCVNCGCRGCASAD